MASPERRTRPSPRRWIAGNVALAVAGCQPQQSDSITVILKAKSRLMQEALAGASSTCVIQPYHKFPGFLTHNTLLVPITVNGVESVGVFDTGAQYSLVSPELAEAAKLNDTGGSKMLHGATGSFKVKQAAAHSVGIGSARLTGNVPLLVWKFPLSHGTELGMQIGLDFLENFDWDIDLPNKTLRPYQISNCSKIEPPWRTSSTGIPLTPVAVAYHWKHFVFGPSQATVPVAFPDGTIEAIVDTGAMDTMLSYQAARDIGVSQSQMNADKTEKVIGLSGDKADYHVHKFPDIAIGEDEFRDFPMLIAPGFDRRDEPMVLGMDYIGSHHIWLSFATGGLYIDSGSPRRPGPPLETAHQVAGLSEPLYPPTATNQTATVNAACMVETDGGLTGCHITGGTGNKLFESAVIEWLTSDTPPIMQPAYANGKPVRQSVDWSLNFVPKAKGGKVYTLPPKAAP